MNREDLKLVEQYFDGTLTDASFGQLQTRLRDDAEVRALLRTFATMDLGLHDIAAGHYQHIDSSFEETRSVPPERATSSLLSASWTRSLLALATLAIIGLGTALWIQSSSSSAEPAAERMIATVTGTGGGVLWTGNGGSVSTSIESGTLLTGGTIEGTSPTSWVELEFLDGSRVTVAGNSRLTISDFDQKILYLKEGSVTSSVKPQAAGSPMLVFTGNSMLEVLGTEFKVESDIEATSLDVTEGKVRLKRLSDGQTIEVPANQRVQSSEGLELSTQPIPDRTSQWKSNLANPYGNWGKWLPATETLPPRLRLVHHRQKDAEGKVHLIKRAGMSVTGEFKERVVLRGDCQLRIRGYAKENQKTVFGLVVRDGNGEFAGYYDSAIPNAYWMDLQTDSKKNPESLHAFEFTIDVADLSLGQDLQRTQQGFKDSPIGFAVDAFYCATPAENAELEVTEVEIVQPKLIE